MNPTVHSDQSPESLEREVDARRSNLNETLNAVEQRLSPNHLMEQTMNYFGEHGGDIAQSVSRSVKDNPLPLILTGVGLAWLMSSQSRSDRQGFSETRYRDQLTQRADERYRSTYPDSPLARTNLPIGDRSVQPSPTYSSTYTDSADDQSVRDKLSQKANEWSDTTDQWKDELSARIRSMKQGAEESAEDWQERVVSASVEHSEMMKQRIQQANQNLSDQYREHAQSAKHYMQEQPLVVGALGIAAGALIGTLLPSTSVEDRWVGEESDEVKSTLTEKAAQVSSEAASTVTDKAQQLRMKGEEQLAKVDAKQETAEEDISPA